MFNFFWTIGWYGALAGAAVYFAFVAQVYRKMVLHREEARSDHRRNFHVYSLLCTALLLTTLYMWSDIHPDLERFPGHQGDSSWTKASAAEMLGLVEKQPPVSSSDSSGDAASAAADGQGSRLWPLLKETIKVTCLWYCLLQASLTAIDLA